MSTLRRRRERLAVGLAFLFVACSGNMSPPPPFPVAGGPRVVRQGDAQVALAAGGGEAWNWSGLATFARYRRGLGHRVDLGGDVMSVLHDDNGIRGTMLGKIGSRIGLAQGVAVEAGVGGSTGWRRSFSQDIALSLGLNRSEEHTSELQSP